MSTIYTRAPKEVIELANQVIDRFHPEFKDAELKVDFIFALGESMGPAIKHGGYPANAICRIISLKDRVKGNGDAEIVIDGDQWNDWSEEQRQALLDHELHHIIIQRVGGMHWHGEGVMLRDDSGRPKLKLRKHDAQFGWFEVIAQRHGAASFECQQAKQVFEEHKVYFQPELLPAAMSGDMTERAARAVRSGGITRMEIRSGGQSVVIDRDSARKIIKGCDAAEALESLKP